MAFKQSLFINTVKNHNTHKKVSFSFIQVKYNTMSTLNQIYNEQYFIMLSFKIQYSIKKQMQNKSSNSP